MTQLENKQRYDLDLLKQSVLRTEEKSREREPVRRQVSMGGQSAPTRPRINQNKSKLTQTLQIPMAAKVTQTENTLKKIDEEAHEKKEIVELKSEVTMAVEEVKETEAPLVEK